jgi:hypothetical protein
MSDNWRNQAIPTEGWRSQAVPVTEETTPALPVKYVGGKGGAVRTSQEHLINSTSVGRVLDAFGEGAAEGWGDEPIGFSPESEQVLRDIGLYRSGEDNVITAPFRAFNEGLIRPLAAGVDSLFRLFPAATKGAAEGLGQIGEEAGLLDPNVTNMADPRNKKRFTDSLDEFLQIGGMVAGGEASYMGTRINVPKAEKGLKSLKEAVEEPAAQKEISSSVLAPGSEIVANRPKNPTDLVAAIRVGPDEVYVGKVGEEHTDIFKRIITDDIAVADRLDTLPEEFGDAYGFYDTTKGKFLSSKEALAEAPNFGISNDGKYGLISPELVAAQNKYIEGQAKPQSLGAAATPPEKLAAPIPPRPDGISPKFVTPAGTIDTAKIGELQDVYGAIEEVAQANAGTAPLATRGEVSWAQTEALAQTAGVLPQELLSRGIGEAWNAHQIDSAMGLLQQGAKELLEASRKARATGSEADTLAAVEAFHKASLYNEAVTGIKTEAGRALNILKKFKQQEAEVQNLSEVLRQLGGKSASMDEILEALKELNNADAGTVNKFVHDIAKVGPTDMFLEYIYNAMLSSPVTHVANMVGNTLAALWEVPVSGLSGAIGATRAALGSKTALAGDRAFVGEAASRLYGMVQGAPEGLRLAWRAIKEETPTQGVSKIDSGKTQAIPGKLGRAIRVPTTALMAADEVFQAMGYRASINAQAYRAAGKAGLTGEKFKQRVAELTQSPTKKMVEKAHEEAAYVTFTSELGKTGKGVQRLLSQHPILKVVLAPFFRTPVNLLKHPIRHSVLSVASRDVQATLMGKKGAIARDEAYSRILLGSGVVTSAFLATQMGRLTGAGPKDPAERAMWMLAGNQPYSFRIGETWHSYARLEPFATLLGVSADAAYIREKLNDDESASIGTLLTYSAGQNVLNKTWLKGVTDLVEAINEPERYGDAYLRNLATRIVPAAVGQASRMDDPYLRDVRTMVDAFKNKYGDSESIYPKRDIFGNAIKREGAAGPDVLSPIFVTNVNKDPVVQELLNLQIFPGEAEREIRGVELTPQQYDDYQLAAGRLLYQSYNQLVNTPGWQNIPSGIRIDVLTKQLSATRERARTYVMFKHPDILQQSMENKYNHLTGAP